jgi:hypothetical protein
MTILHQMILLILKLFLDVFKLPKLSYLQTILTPQTGQFISGQALPRCSGIILPQDGQTHFEAIAFTFF